MKFLLLNKRNLKRTQELGIFVHVLLKVWVGGKEESWRRRQGLVDEVCYDSALLLGLGN